jgi:hypothetical protein
MPVARDYHGTVTLLAAALRLSPLLFTAFLALITSTNLQPHPLLVDVQSLDRVVCPRYSISIDTKRGLTARVLDFLAFGQKSIRFWSSLVQRSEGR